MHGPVKDVEWMKRYLQDDPAAFSRIYEAYSDSVYGYLTKRVRVGEERDELFQKIWIKFHRSRDQWSPEYPLLQWLFVISRSVVIDWQRKAGLTALDRAEHPGEKLEKRLGGIVSDRPDPEESLAARFEDSKSRDLMDEISLQGLTPDQIEVLRSRAIDEEDYEKIAERLGKSPANIRKIYSRAIEKLKVMRWRPAQGRNR